MYQPTTERLPGLDVYPPTLQRRLTVLLRLLLLIPQFIVVWLLGIVTFFAAIAAWFAALVLGRLPDWAANYLSGYVAYVTRVYASLYLLVDSYPPFSFSAPASPVQVHLDPGPLNRLAVFFRIILVIPAAIIAAVLTSGWHALAFFCWLTVLIMGRTPEPLFDATAAILRYSMRLEAYFLMLSSSYPKRLFGDEGDQGMQSAPRDWGDQGTGAPATGAPVTGPAKAPPPEPVSRGGVAVAEGRGVSPTRPLLLTTGGKVLLVVFIVAGILSGIGSGIGSGNNGQTSSYTTSAGHP